MKNRLEGIVLFLKLKIKTSEVELLCVLEWYTWSNIWSTLVQGSQSQIASRNNN